MQSETKVHIGILGDPAKADLYSQDFFEILKWDDSQSTFALIGASESDVGKQEYQWMFRQFTNSLQGYNFPPIPHLTNSFRKDFSSHIGLFPSAVSHLIKGPGFAFDPIPINSSSSYLKFKAKILSRILSPFLPFSVRNLAYHPMGGKAAAKTRAMSTLSQEAIVQNFVNARADSFFDWFYLEAGSGSKMINLSLLYDVLVAQMGFMPLDRFIVPRAIYGGGIDTVAKITGILFPKVDPPILPQLIIVGNISEQNVSTTYKIVEKAAEFNE